MSNLNIIHLYFVLSNMKHLNVVYKIFYNYFKYLLIFNCRSIYPVGKVFFLIQTIDKSKQYMPENKIVIDVPAGLNIFSDSVGIVNHVKELTEELCKTWNAKYAGKPEVKFNLNILKNFL